jgi:hypothetical protein
MVATFLTRGHSINTGEDDPMVVYNRCRAFYEYKYTMYRATRKGAAGTPSRTEAILALPGMLAKERSPHMLMTPVHQTAACAHTACRSK